MFALQHGDFTMTESAAINTYLADTFRGSADLVPSSGQLRGRQDLGWKLLQSKILKNNHFVAIKLVNPPNHHEQNCPEREAISETRMYGVTGGHCPPFPLCTK